MRKQKLQRQNKMQEEFRHKVTLQEEKRRKLKELQDKTFKIIFNKRPSRQRSPTKKSYINETHRSVSETDLHKHNTLDHSQLFSKPKSSVCIMNGINGLNSPKVSSHNLESIQPLTTPSTTLESRIKNDVALVTPNCHLRTAPTVEECIKAATKIKAVYKG